MNSHFTATSHFASQRLKFYLPRVCFRAFVQVYDTSTVSFTGRVSFPSVKPQSAESTDAMTKFTNAFAWPDYVPGGGCPISDIQVCAYSHKDGSLLGCVLTAFDGTYSLGVPGGTAIEIRIVYAPNTNNTHNFVRVGDPTKQASESGNLITQVNVRFMVRPPMRC